MGKERFIERQADVRESSARLLEKIAREGVTIDPAP